MKEQSEVIILGTGETFEACPFDKETWAVAKILLFSHDHFKKPLPKGYHKNIDALFNIDKVDEMLTFTSPKWMAGGWTIEKYKELINNLDVPFITSFKIDGINKIEEYPLKEIVEAYQNTYFTNSICYMIAYAILTGVKRIDLWGVNQHGMKEYVNERKGVEFWIGLAMGHGIQFQINGPSHLLKKESKVLYGYKRPFSELRDYFNIDYYGDN